MQLVVAGKVYSFVAFLDEYSRYIVHHELLLGMDGLSVSTVAQKGIETLPRGPDGKPALRRPRSAPTTAVATSRRSSMRCSRRTA